MLLLLFCHVLQYCLLALLDCQVKWTVLQQLFFLDLIQDSTCLYRESVVHIGNAYGFNSSRNLDVLHRWCLLLIKHNCQDHVGVLELAG